MRRWVKVRSSAEARPSRPPTRTNATTGVETKRTIQRVREVIGVNVSPFEPLYRIHRLTVDPQLEIDRGRAHRRHPGGPHDLAARHGLSLLDGSAVEMAVKR